MRGSGSEALWPLLQAMQPLRAACCCCARRAAASGCREAAAAAARDAAGGLRALAARALRRVARALAAAAAGRLASVISSSDAVDALADVLGDQPGVLSALRAGPALASHPRIGRAAACGGLARAAVCAPEPQAIVASLREAGG